MQPGTTPLRQLVKQEVPEQFLSDVVLLLFGVYQSTYEQIDSEFESTGEGIDLLPIYRRARIEKGLRDIATRYKVNYENMTIRPARNEANNCWHNEIICNRILLTQSHVKRYDEMVRSADYRHTLAKASQFELFDEYNNCLGDFYYGIFLHGAPDPKAKYPTFVRLAFPSKDCASYVENIDLLKLCNFDITNYPKVEEEIIDDKISKPEFRTDLRKQKEA